MANFPSLNLPQAWKPIFRTLAAHGWELQAQIDAELDWEYRQILRFQAAAAECYVCFWDDAEWCGNNFQNRALTILGLSAALPQTQAPEEENSLLLTEDWESELSDFVTTFMCRNFTELDNNSLIIK
jgi:hypothetical protein